MLSVGKREQVEQTVLHVVDENHTWHKYMLNFSLNEKIHCVTTGFILQGTESQMLKI